MRITPVALAIALISTTGLVAPAARADDADAGRPPAKAGEAPEGAYAAEVTATRLNLRAGPGPAYQVVVRAARGDRVVVLRESENAPGWVELRVPGGYEAWVYGRFLAPGGDGTARVTVDRLLVRPRATTKYHQLAGQLRKGETVRVTGRRETEEGLWYRIRAPQRIPLYASAEYLDNVGVPEAATVESAPADAASADSGGGAADPAPARKTDTDADRRFRVLAARLRGELDDAKTADELRGLRARVEAIDRSALSLENRERRVRLIYDIMETEQTIVLEEVRRREEEVRGDLDRKLQEIERRYQRRLQEIKDELNRTRKPRFTALGVVRWAPDPFGRHPSFRLVEGGKMRYFLIAPDFDLKKFSGKRVGVVGITDPESGTGYETVMVKRIEILGER